MFANGLGSDEYGIKQQVEFIGRDYRGIAAYQAAYVLIPDIAHDIFANRDQYEHEALSASNILTQIANRNAIKILYRPFERDFQGKRNWKVWAAKFWHHLNPRAFPIRDSRVDTFFILPSSTPIDEYLELLNRFRAFVVSHQEWLPHLWRADGEVDGRVDGVPVCSDNKLWDKMCYGLVDLDNAGE
jgi:hypothetical protein